MASTVEDVARGVLASLGSSTGLLLAAQWAADRYKQIAARTRLKSLRRVGELVVPTLIDAGTATFTRGSRTVTGNVTAQAAWSNAVAGRSIRARVTWYEIDAFVGGELRLKSGFAEDTSTAGAYKLVPRFVTLDATARWIGNVMVSMRRRSPIHRISLEEMDVMFPSRQLVGPPGRAWASVGDRINADGELCKAVEVYPYGDDAELYHYIYWPVVDRLRLHDQLPPEIDEHVLREGTLVDAMRHKAATAADAGQVEIAAFWRNEYRAQETKWERLMLEAFQADDAGDDLTFILQRSGFSHIDRDIRTAADEVWARWSR